MNVKMKLLFFYITYCLLPTAYCVAQQTSITGRVIQKEIKTPVQGVNLYLESTNLGAFTNGNGNYIIKNVAAGSYSLVASIMGYMTVNKMITVKEGETITVDYEITELVMDLPSVVVKSVTLTGGNTGIKEIPGSATYISPKQLEIFSYTDINRTMRTVPGVNVQEEDGFGLRPNIGLRGTGSERSSKITLMEDGILIAPAPYAAPAAYYFPTIGRMQAIEILKGSSQIKYGPYTTGGAINFISTQIPAEFSAKLNLIAGSFGSRNIHAYFGDSYKNIGFLIETFQYKAVGFKQLDGVENMGFEKKNTGFDKKDFLAKVKINTNSDTKFNQSLFFKIGQTTETSNETYLGLTQEDFNNEPFRRYAASQMDQMNTKQTHGSLLHSIHLAKYLDITTTVYRTDFKRNWYKLDKIKCDTCSDNVNISELLDDPFNNLSTYYIMTGAMDSSSNDNALNIKANNRSYYSQGIQTILGFIFEKGNLSHKIDVGFRIHQDQIDRFQWVDKYKMDNGVMHLTSKGIPGTESNRIITANAFAGYIQYKIKYGDLTATPGLRYEYILLEYKDYGKNNPDRKDTIPLSNERKNQVDVFIPGIGIDYKFNQNISAFLGIHKGFAPPGTKDESKPEESINYELGTRFNKNAIFAQAVVFFNDYNNLSGVCLQSVGCDSIDEQFNAGEVNALGLELLITYDLLSSKTSQFSIPVSLVYTYTNATFQNNFQSDYEPWGTVEIGYHLPYIAPNQISFNAGLKHRKFSLNLSSKYNDGMRTIAGKGKLLDKYKTDPQFILDFSVDYSMSRNVVFFSSITNLTNQIYVVARRPAGLRPGMPRAVNVGVKAKF